jgi:MULE transposase domain
MVTHIKTRYQGIILAATGIDALGQLFPLAYAVVDAENEENWRWMLQLIRRVLEQSAPQFLEAKVSLCLHSI